MKIPGLNNVNQGIQTFILCFLIAPLIFMVGPKRWNPKLKGSFTKAHASDFTLDRWWSGYFQDEFEDWINDHIGLRAWFVKANYQYDYSLFDTLHTAAVLRGKENYFYETNYVRTHKGLDFIGQSTIQRRVETLSEIRQYLKENNSELLIILAPGKGSFYPNYFPESYDTIPGQLPTNYSVFKEVLSQTDIPTLDFHSWFLEMKDTTSHALFPNTGIHWSRYGALLAADSILKLLPHLTLKPSPQLHLFDFEKTRNTRFVDDDLEKSLNLVFDLPHLEMTYPQFQFSKRNKKMDSKVVTIADSYFWDMFNFGLATNALNGGEFWYYNKQVYPASYTKNTLLDSSYYQNIHENDVVMLMCTDANLFKFPFGFDKDMAPPIQKIKKEKAALRLTKTIERIYNTEKWINSLKEEAKQKAIPLDQHVRENAEYVIWKEDNQK
ncbi:MAG: hypothetical protein ACJAY8_000414 [Sphingobacteriales bacterium]|jgi:hypothetical protein